MHYLIEHDQRHINSHSDADFNSANLKYTKKHAS